MRGTGFLVERPWYLDPGGPVEHVLIDREDDYGFHRKVEEGLFRSLRLIGRGLTVSVLNTHGKVLVRGRPLLSASPSRL